MSFLDSSITYKIIDDNVIQVGDSSLKDHNAVSSCPNSVTIKGNIEQNGINYITKRIGQYSFRTCKSLTSITLPDSIEVIETRAFDQTGLTTINLPKQLVEIGKWAFGANYLTSIQYSPNLQIIVDCAFSPSHAIEDFNVPITHEYLSSDSYGALLNKNKTILYNVPASLTMYSIPSSVQIINGGAFQYTKLKTITFPKNCHSFGYYSLSDTTFDNLIFLGNIVYMDTIIANFQIQSITYHGVIPFNPTYSVFSKTPIQITVCKGYKSDKFASFTVTVSNECEAVPFDLSDNCPKCATKRAKFFIHLKLFISILIF